MIGSSDVIVEGGWDTGYAINSKKILEAAFVPVVGPPTAPCPFTATLVCDSISASRDLICSGGCVGTSGSIYYDITNSAPGFDAGGHWYKNANLDGAGRWVSGTVESPDETHYYQTVHCIAFSSDCPGGTPYLDITYDFLTGCPPEITDSTCVINPFSPPVFASFEFLDDVMGDPCALAIGSLPPYDGDFDDPCGASRDSTDTSCTIQRFRYKFTFPSATAACTLRWIERFTPDVGSIVDTPRSFAVTAGMTETSVYEVIEPATDGAITIIY